MKQKIYKWILCSSVIDETWDDIFNDLLEESEFKIHKTDTVSVTISDKLMILGMIDFTVLQAALSILFMSTSISRTMVKNAYLISVESNFAQNIFF
jgi:hypothetical protein